MSPAECANRAQCVAVDRANGKVAASAIFSWREKEFAAAYADKAPAAFATRSPIERAVLAFVVPKLLATEKEFLDANAFQTGLLEVRLDAERPDGSRRPVDWIWN